MADNPPAKKVRIQLSTSTKNVSASNASDNGPNTNQTLGVSSTGVSAESLAMLCDSRYMSRKRKDKRVALIKAPTARHTEKKTNPSSGSEGEGIGAAVPATDASSAALGPRVEMVNGKLVIKESSLVVPSGESQLPEIDYEEIEEGAHSTSRYSSFMQKRPAKVWGIEETRHFYKALRQCGLEFSLMQSLFPNRTRKELKLKFQREEREHPELVKRALETSLPLELAPFELQLGSKLDYHNVDLQITLMSQEVATK